MTTLAQYSSGIEEIIQKTDNVVSYIVTVLQILNKDKYEQVMVTRFLDDVVKVVLIAQESNFSSEEYHINDVLQFEAEAQACYETLWQKNPEYLDQSYLACIAYEKTLKKYIKGAVDGASVSKT